MNSTTTGINKKSGNGPLPARGEESGSAGLRPVVTEGTSCHPLSGGVRTTPNSSTESRKAYPDASQPVNSRLPPQMGQNVEKFSRYNQPRHEEHHSWMGQQSDLVRVKKLLVRLQKQRERAKDHRHQAVASRMAWVRDLTTEGVEPNPGPHHQQWVGGNWDPMVDVEDLGEPMSISTLAPAFPLSSTQVFGAFSIPLTPPEPMEGIWAPPPPPGPMEVEWQGNAFQTIPVWVAGNFAGPTQAQVTVALQRSGFETHPGPPKPDPNKGKEKPGEYKHSTKINGTSTSYKPTPKPPSKGKPKTERKSGGKSKDVRKREGGPEKLVGHAKPAEIRAAVDEEELATRIEAIKVAFPGIPPRFIMPLCGPGFTAAVRLGGQGVDMEQVFATLGIAPPSDPPPPDNNPPPPETPPPTHPIRGTVLTSRELRRRLCCCAVLPVVLALMATWGLVLLTESPRVEGVAVRALDWASTLTNYSVSRYSVAERLDMAAKVYCSSHHPQLCSRLRSHTKWLKTTLDGEETWEQYLNKRNTTQARQTLYLMWMSKFLLTTTWSQMVSNFTGAYTNFITEWLYKPWRLWGELRKVFLYLKIAYFTSVEDREWLYDWYFGDPNVELQREMEKVPTQLVITLNDAYIGTARWVDRMILASNVWLRLVLRCMLFLLAYVTICVLDSYVQFTDLALPTDQRLRTMGHINMTSRPTRMHVYHFSVVPLLLRWKLHVVDHWVAVADSERADGADAKTFYSNIHLKFLRLGELNIPDRDYQRLKKDTITFVKLMDRGFCQGGVRSWDELPHLNE